jgi:hypothetical protein
MLTLILQGKSQFSSAVAPAGILANAPASQHIAFHSQSSQIVHCATFRGGVSRFEPEHRSALSAPSSNSLERTRRSALALKGGDSQQKPS